METVGALGSKRGIEVDDSHWPLVVVTFASSTTDADWKEMFAHYERLYERRQPFHIDNDGISMTAAVSASQRRLIADGARAHAAMSRKWCLGGATVVANALTRGVVTAITWVAPPAYKLTIHASLAEAVDEALATFEAKGIAISASMRDYRASVAKSRRAG
jgi:hypothetical protein